MEAFCQPSMLLRSTGVAQRSERTASLRARGKWGTGFEPERSRFARARVVGRRVATKMQEETYYDVLKVPRDADAMTIKKAYRREALRNHPDVSSNADASNVFLEVQQAYKVLSNPKERQQYDNDLKYRSRRGGASGGGAWGDWVGTSTRFSEEYRRRRSERDGPFPEDLGDSFGSIFNDFVDGFSKVASEVVGKGGVGSDFMDFLETQLDGEKNTAMDELLQNGSVAELQAELDDVNFVLEQLEARETRLKDEIEAAKRLQKDWRSRSEREHLDPAARQAAADKALAFEREITRARNKLQSVQKMIAEQKSTSFRIKTALAAKEGQDKANADVRNAREIAKKNVTAENEKMKRDIDDELQRMKRELGLL